MNVVFSDLDGTLLDSDTYSFLNANAGLQVLKEKNIPLSICSSKTKAEIMYWRKRLNNYHPFIVENGGGIFIPKDYFSFEILYDENNDDFYIIELGSKTGLVHETVNELKNNYRIKSFLDMTPQEIAEDTDLPLNQARLAKKRKYSIPFKIIDNNQLKNILNKIEKRNLQYTRGGRFFHLMGDIDKGGAVKVLLYLYEKKFGTEIESIGIGDSENDFSMLNQVDKAYLVKKKNGSYASDNYLHAEGIGPKGWQEIIEKELET